MKRTHITWAIVVGLGTLMSSVPSFAKEWVVVQKDKKFDITQLKVKKGDTIVFKNDEKDITHNVYSLGPTNDFELKVQKPGESSSVVLAKPGKTNVECAIHTNMKLEITVEK